MHPRSTKKPPVSAASRGRGTSLGGGSVKTAPGTKSSPKPKQYRQIDNVRYDNAALLVADDAVSSRGKLTLSDARKVFESVLDGPGITKTELDTLQFVANGGENGTEYKVVPSAKTFLIGKVEEHGGTTTKRNSTNNEEEVAKTTEKKRKASSNAPAAKKTTKQTTTHATPRTEIKSRKRKAETENTTASKRRVSVDPKTVTKSRKGKEEEEVPTTANPNTNTAARRTTTQKVRFASSVSPSKTPKRNKVLSPGKTKSPLFAASPPASPNTWLRRRDSTEPSPSVSRGGVSHTSQGGGTTHTQSDNSSEEDGDSSDDETENETNATTDVPVSFFDGANGNVYRPFGGADFEKQRNSDARVICAHTTVLDPLLEILRQPVSLQTATAAVGCSFVVGCAIRVVIRVIVGDTSSYEDGFDWSILAEKWNSVETAVGRLADTIASGRMDAS